MKQALKKPPPVSFHDVPVGSYYLLHDTLDADEQADAVVMAARHMTNIQAWHRLCERITQREDVT